MNVPRRQTQGQTQIMTHNSLTTPPRELERGRAPAACPLASGTSGSSGTGLLEVALLHEQRLDRQRVREAGHERCGLPQVVEGSRVVT